jgi:glutathione S-transferase
MAFGSSVLDTIAGFYNAPDAGTLQARRVELQARFMQLEQVLPDEGPYFAGSAFGLVDAVFGPVFRYFDTFERLGEQGFFDGAPKVSAWRAALSRRPSVQVAASPQYELLLREFLQRRGGELSRRIAAHAEASGPLVGVV